MAKSAAAASLNRFPIGSIAEVTLEGGSHNSFKVMARLMGMDEQVGSLMLQPCFPQQWQSLSAVLQGDISINVRMLLNDGEGHVTEFESALVRNEQRPFQWLMMATPKQMQWYGLRHHQRSRVDLPVTLQWIEGNEQWQGQVSNLSIGGCACELPLTLAPRMHTPLSVRFEQFSATAQLVSYREFKQHQVWALQFESLNAVTQVQLYQLLWSQLQHEAPLVTSLE